MSKPSITVTYFVHRQFTHHLRGILDVAEEINTLYMLLATTLRQRRDLDRRIVLPYKTLPMSIM